MRKCLRKLLLAVVIATTAYAQQSQFEVATVKRAPSLQGDLVPINLGALRNCTLTLANTTLSECIQYAYGLASGDLITGPDWIKSREVRFDIVAKVSADVPQDQVRGMLQNLLAERLKLSLHHEPREMTFLALVVTKGGPKLAPAKVNTPPAQIPPQVAGRIIRICG